MILRSYAKWSKVSSSHGEGLIESGSVKPNQQTIWPNGVSSKNYLLMPLWESNHFGRRLARVTSSKIPNQSEPLRFQKENWINSHRITMHKHSHVRSVQEVFMSMKEKRRVSPGSVRSPWPSFETRPVLSAHGSSSIGSSLHPHTAMS